MEKTFYYTKITESTYNESLYEWEDYGDEIAYTVGTSDLRWALAHILYDEYMSKEVDKSQRQIIIPILNRMLDNFDLVDELVETYEEELKEYFEEEALN